MKLLFEATIKYLIGIIIVGLLIFIPAGTLNYFNGILFMCLLFIPMFIVGIVLFIKNSSLLRSRLDSKEKNNDQKEVLIFSALLFIIGFIIAGLNFRYKWIELPNIVIIISSIIFILSYILYAEVLRENKYLSRTIEVSKDQKVIDKGLYSVVRHPMYLITIFLFLSIPLILGSIISFLIFLVYPFIIVKRIKKEEEVLSKKLKGYTEYKIKVKYRLIPFIW